LRTPPDDCRKYAAMSSMSRSVISVGRNRGLDPPVFERRGDANWLWLPSAGCLRAMLRFAGFDPLGCYEHRHVTTVVARATPVETLYGPRADPPA